MTNKIIDAWGVFGDSEIPDVVCRSEALARVEAGFRGRIFKPKPIRIVTDPNVIIEVPGEELLDDEKPEDSEWK